MTKRMLIYSTHPEETRVVVVDGNRLEDFDFETATKKQLKGNIYLARITRVEPSLQAAFVEYGGNRHGFLAFSEIHPDYYRIPIEDREALLREERARASEEMDDDGDNPDRHSCPAIWLYGCGFMSIWCRGCCDKLCCSGDIMLDVGTWIWKRLAVLVFSIGLTVLFIYVIIVQCTGGFF